MQGVRALETRPSSERGRPKVSSAGVASGSGSSSSGISSTTLVLLLIVVSNAIMVMFLYSDAPSAAHHHLLSVVSGRGGVAGGVGSSGRRSPRHRHHRVAKPTPAQSKMLEMRQRNFQDSPEAHSFVQFSAYRLTPTRFVALGLSAVVAHDSREATECLWESRNGKATMGSVTIKYPGEQHGRKYETILLFCQVEEPTSARLGGQLTMTIDGNDEVVYLESPGSPEPAPEGAADAQRTFERNLTFCSAPMFGALEPQRLVEWIEFHRIIHGLDYMHMYDAGAFDEELISVLEPYLKGDTMEVTDFRGPADYDTWSYSQTLSVNDCGFKTRHSSRWVLMMDVDEYLVIPEPPHSLQYVLDTMDVPHPWISFGSVTFPLNICGKVQEAGWEPWAVELLVFREPDVHCKEPTKYYSRDVCLKWDGHRKYVFNPRSTYVLQIHRVGELWRQPSSFNASMPADETGSHSHHLEQQQQQQQQQLPGLNAHVGVMRLHHYRGLGIRGVAMCRQIISLSLDPPKGYLRDLTAARLAVAAHRHLLA